MTKPFRAASTAAFLAKSPRFFASPAVAGRKIVCGLSYLQRIGKTGKVDVWFPSTLQQQVASRISAGDETVLDEFQVEWAAVREFELLRDAGNLAIYDLKVENLNRSFEEVQKMRAGGYRVTVITLGRYIEPGTYDELRLLDKRLQDEITRLIHMLYMEEESARATSTYTAALHQECWNSTDTLPHILQALGEMRLFKPHKQSADTKMAETFLKVLELLPQKHMAHDMAVGLALPEATAHRGWTYLAAGEYQFSTFQTALSTVFGQFDCVNMDALQGRTTSLSSQIMPAMHHMRGHGDRLRPVYEEGRRAMAQIVM